MEVSNLQRKKAFDNLQLLSYPKQLPQLGHKLFKYIGLAEECRCVIPQPQLSFALKTFLVEHTSFFDI